MLTEVMESYGLVKEFRQAGYYETVDQQQLFKDVIAAISRGQLVVLSGIVGCGKTVTLRQLREVLDKEGKILVSKSLSVDKNRSTPATLVSALFYDLSAEKNIKIPSQDPIITSYLVSHPVQGFHKARFIRCCGRPIDV